MVGDDPSSKGHGHFLSKWYSWQNSDNGYGHERLPDRTVHKVPIAQKRIASHSIIFKLPICIASQQTTPSSPSCLRAVADTILPPPNAKCAHLPDTPNADSNSAPSTVQSDLQIFVISLISYSTGSNAPTPYNNLDGLRPGNHKVLSSK